MLRLYTANGAEVLVPLPRLGEGEAGPDFIALLALANSEAARAIEAGWRVSGAASLDAGESREDVGWVVRTTKDGRSGTVNVLHLYSTNAGWTKPFLVVYLNTREDIQAFEAASGLDVANLPEYVGEGRIEKGKKAQTDALVIRVRRPFAAVHAPNPKYSEAEAQATKAANKAYTIPKKKFVRWAEAKSGAPAPTAPAPQQQSSKPVHSPAPIPQSPTAPSRPVDPVQQAQAFIDQQRAKAKPPTPQQQADFINALAAINASGSQPTLTHELQDIEAGFRNGAFTEPQMVELRAAARDRSAVLASPKR